MAEIHRQMRQQFLDILSIVMPLREPSHRKGMAEGMNGRPSLTRCAADSCTSQQPTKHQTLRTVVQSLSLSIRKKHVHAFCAQLSCPLEKIPAQMVSDRGVQNDVPRFPKLRIADYEIGRVGCEPQIFESQPECFPDAHTGAG